MGNPYLCPLKNERMDLVFATNNEHKLKEIRAILRGKVNVLSLSDIGCKADIPETADTLEGNARIKAEYVFNTYGLDCFADDTGLEVKALHGAPGVRSARYAGEAHDSVANRKKLLDDLSGIEDRSARFRTVIVLIIKGEEYVFDGTVGGQITTSEKGTQGFGYDAVFMPDGYDKTFAELAAEQKNKISHRANAVGKLAQFLNSYMI